MQRSTDDRTVQRFAGLATAVATVMALLSGCSSPQQPPPPATCELPQNVQLTVQASERINLDDNGRSLPTIVRIYQLKNLTRMENAQFEDIWRRATETLGDDLQQVDEVTVYPNQTLRRSFTRKPTANYIVGVGIFRHPAGVSWRTVFEMPPANGAARCAAMQRNPGSNPPASPDPHFVFMLEDYRIEEGEEEVHEADAGHSGVQLPGQSSLPDTSNTQAPNAPQSPAAPQAPAAPTGPSMKPRSTREAH